MILRKFHKDFGFPFRFSINSTGKLSGGGKKTFHIQEGINLELLEKILLLLIFVNNYQDLRRVYLNYHELSSISTN